MSSLSFTESQGTTVVVTDQVFGFIQDIFHDVVVKQLIHFDEVVEAAGSP